MRIKAGVGLISTKLILFNTFICALTFLSVTPLTGSDKHWRSLTGHLRVRSCVNVEVSVLGSPCLIALMVSVDVKLFFFKDVQDLCESRGGRPGLPVHNSPYGLWMQRNTWRRCLGAVWKWRWPSWAPRPQKSLWSLNATQHLKMFRSCVKVEVDVLGSPSLIIHIGLCGRKQHWTRTGYQHAPPLKQKLAPEWDESKEKAP